MVPLPAVVITCFSGVHTVHCTVLYLVTAVSWVAYARREVYSDQRCDVGDY